jgi:hypothetical protein
MHPANTACFLDFDHTLFHTDEFFHVDVRQAFLRLGIDAMEWEQSYAAVWPTGYTLEKHVEEVSCHSGSRLPLEQMKRVLQNSFSDLRRYLFSDVLPFLRRTKGNGMRLYLLSFGDREWQRYKISACAVSGYFDDMLFAATPGGKSRLVQEQVKKLAGTVHVIDNNPVDLDLIRDQGPEIQTYHMNRVPDEMRFPADDLSRLRFLEARRYLERVPRHRHVPCRTLDSVLQERKR